MELRQLQFPAVQSHFKHECAHSTCSQPPIYKMTFKLLAKLVEGYLFKLADIIS